MLRDQPAPSIQVDRSHCNAGRRMSTVFLLVSLLSSVGVLPSAAGNPFYMGTDISLTTFMQQQNVSFVNNGVPKPVDQLLYDRGANLFRLRLFVNPQSNYTNQNFGAIQSQAYDIALAQQIKAHAPNAKFLLDFQYSDTWADPGHQTKPAAWASQTFAALNSTVHDYTVSALTSMRNAGVKPDMVQVGNEVTNGMLWSDGSIVYSGTTQQQNQSWQKFGQLLNSAIAGVRDVDAQTPGRHTNVVLHIDGGSV